MASKKSFRKLFTQFPDGPDITSGKMRINISSRISKKDNIDKILSRAEEILGSDTGLNALAYAGAIILQERTVHRFKVTPLYPIETAVESGGAKSNRRSARQIGAVGGLISEAPIIIGRGKVGFASRKALDKIEITDTTSSIPLEDEAMAAAARELVTSGKASVLGSKRPAITESPYIHTWQIIEFGTGKLAAPEKRLEDDGRGTKVSTGTYAGSGAWYLFPSRKFPIILGQRGMHFLFPTRTNTATAREDIEAIRQYISDAFSIALRREPKLK